MIQVRRHSRFVMLAMLSISLVASACSPAVQPSPVVQASSGAPLSATERAQHVLDRLAFGPRPGDVQRVASMGPDRWIAQQLDPSAIPDAAAAAHVDSLEAERNSLAEVIADHVTPVEVQRMMRTIPTTGPFASLDADSALLKRAVQRQGQLTAQVYAARTIRAVESDRQLLEVMTDFWENHFSVSNGKTLPYALIEYDRDVIRPRALGKFRDLLFAVAKSPAMLYFLDNWQSAVDSLHDNVDEQRISPRRSHSTDPDARAFAALPHRRGAQAGPNENYARELMELHTLGVDGGYTQHDVTEVARAFTGWTLDSPVAGARFVFRPELHDANEKIVLGHALPAGRGMEDGEDVLRLLASSPATARFLVTKLARHFISDTPPSSVVDRCSATYLKTDGDIRETVRCIVTGPEFFSRAAYRAKVKTPFEFVVSSVRATGGRADTTQRLAQQMARLGQPMFGRVSPDGWPDRAADWVNAGALLSRVNFALTLAKGDSALLSPAFERR